MQETWLAWVTESLEWIRASGWQGVGWFVALFILSCVFFLPGSALTVGAGAVYGFWWGAVLVTISSTLGALVNFLTSRYLLRTWLSTKLHKYPKFLALDRAIEKDGWKVILISRISPVLPHSLVSYIAGITQISCGRFTLASFLGFLPISIGYSYVGALLGAVARTKMQITSNDPLTWAFYGIGLVVTVLSVVWSAKLAAKALRSSIPME